MAYLLTLPSSSSLCVFVCELFMYLRTIRKHFYLVVGFVGFFLIFVTFFKFLSLLIDKYFASRHADFDSKLQFVGNKTENLGNF